MHDIDRLLSISDILMRKELGVDDDDHDYEEY